MPHIFIDKLHIKTKYSISGFLPLPLNGDLEFTLSNMEVHGNGRVKIYERNGVEYFNIEQAKLMFASIKPGNLKFSLPIGRPIDVAASRLPPGPIFQSTASIGKWPPLARSTCG